jgi:hypothetical protein
MGAEQSGPSRHEVRTAQTRYVERQRQQRPRAHTKQGRRNERERVVRQWTTSHEYQHLHDRDHNSCFPGAAIVRTRGRGDVPISTVKVGECVWDGTSYSEVFLLSRADADAEAEYVTITTAATVSRHGAQTDTLRLTTGHLVLVRSPSTEQDSTEMVESLKPAENVARGDFVRLAHSQRSPWREVGDVTTPVIATDGAFAPLTMSGYIAVDNMVCSVYTVTNPPEVFVPLTAPVRLAYTVAPQATRALEGAVWDEKTPFSGPRPWPVMA